MKITIRHPAGLEIQFEGEPAEFDRFTSFLTELPAFVGTLGTQSLPAIGGNDDDGDEQSIDPREVHARIETVGARSDIERVTIVTQAGVDAGLGGVDYATVERIYQELGFPRPASMRAAFSNAKQKGYVRSLGQGRWSTTIAGENFALHGLRVGGRASLRRGRRAPQLVSGQQDGETD